MQRSRAAIDENPPAIPRMQIGVHTRAYDTSPQQQPPRSKSVGSTSKAAGALPTCLATEEESLRRDVDMAMRQVKRLGFLLAILGRYTTRKSQARSKNTHTHFVQSGRGSFIRPQVAPYQGRHSRASICIADSSGSMEPIKKRGRWQAEKAVQQYTKTLPHGQNRESQPEKPDSIFCDATNNSWPCGVWDLVASTERRFCGTHRLKQSTNGQ